MLKTKGYNPVSYPPNRYGCKSCIEHNVRQRQQCFTYGSSGLRGKHCKCKKSDQSKKDLTWLMGGNLLWEILGTPTAICGCCNNMELSYRFNFKIYNFCKVAFYCSKKCEVNSWNHYKNIARPSTICSKNILLTYQNKKNSTPSSQKRMQS